MYFHTPNFFALFLQDLSTTSAQSMKLFHVKLFLFGATPYVCSTLFSPNPSFKWSGRKGIQIMTTWSPFHKLFILWLHPFCYCHAWTEFKKAKAAKLWPHGHRSINCVHLSPASVHLSPGSVHLSPASVHLSPASVHLSPASVHLSPVSVHLSPASGHLSPAKEGGLVELLWTCLAVRNTLVEIVVYVSGE